MMKEEDVAPDLKKIVVNDLSESNERGINRSWRNRERGSAQIGDGKNKSFTVQALKSA
jgi:hypothetical protein